MFNIIKKEKKGRLGRDVPTHDRKTRLNSIPLCQGFSYHYVLQWQSGDKNV